jgi:hypothetical protein
MRNIERRAATVSVLVFGLLAGVFSVACNKPRRETSAAPAVSASAATPVAQATHESDELLITALSSPPGRAIAQEKDGFFCRFFEYSGTGDYGERFRNALEGIRSEGKKKGANAFVQASVSSESHEIQGSKWHSSIVHICGDFVLLE